MIDFLKKYGITDKVIQEIKKLNSNANLYNLNCNQDEAIKIIQCLRDKGVTCVEELLMYKIDLFFMDFDSFKNGYLKQDVENFVKQINDDYLKINEFYN